MKTIYRVEHSKENIGPVFAGPYESDIVECTTWASPSSNYHGDDDHPEPFADPLLMKIDFPNNWRNDYFCGFESLSQLKNWFTKTEISNLKKFGFVIAAYSSKKTLIGKTQVLFVPTGKRKIISK